jgi:hypothetical protein
MSLSVPLSRIEVLDRSINKDALKSYAANVTKNPKIDISRILLFEIEVFFLGGKAVSLSLPKIE